MRKRILLSLILIAALLLTGCQSILDLAMSNLAGDQWSNYTIPFEEMTYVRPDLTEAEQLVERIENMSQSAATTAQDLIQTTEELFGVINEAQTMLALADIHYSKDLTNAFYKAEYEYCSSQISTLSALVEQTMVALGASPLADDLEELYLGDGYLDPYQPPEGAGEDWQYQPVWDQEFSRLNDQESALISEYYAAQETLAQLDPEQADYYDQWEQTTGPILVELIALRQEIAQYAGYDSYEAYANAWLYNRNYSQQELEQYTRDIQTLLVPLYQQMQELDWESFFVSTVNAQDCLDYVGSAAKKMRGLVAEAYEEMTARNLYDLTPGDNKAAGSFEIYLTSFAAPYILVNPSQTIDDYSAFAHEFGHFVNEYAAYGTVAGADVSEVLSQAMDYLCLEYATSLSQEQMEQLRTYVMTSALGVYVEQMAQYTFERRAYQLTGTDLTVENLSAIYAEVARDFGFEEEDCTTPLWAATPHYFQAPFYVYGYITSGDVAMQIYQMELQEPGSGLDLYSQWACRWEDLPLETYLEEYHLENPLAEGRVEAVAQTFSELLS